MIHKDMEVYKASMLLVKEIYRITATFPKAEIYGLSSQMRRAAVSVPSNIAEGCARKSQKELLQFLSIAQGSLAELDTQIEISLMLDFVDYQTASAELGVLLQKTRQLLMGFIRSVHSKLDKI
ncbi:MAG: four helix bundle protein [Candidatus Cloacimonetes bacterium]|nr:four helix bundle protein [Candidatus Cloacimonadota bacterium]